METHLKHIILMFVLAFTSHVFAGQNSIRKIYTPQSQMYFYNDVMSFSLVFDQDVVVSGQPTMTLILDSGRVEAEYSSGSGTKKITFKHQIEAGDFDHDGINILSQLNTSWGDIKSLDGSSIDLNLTPALRYINLKNILVRGY